MATPPQNVSGNDSVNVIQVDQDASSSDDEHFMHFGPGVYIIDEDEHYLFCAWINLPQPSLNIECHIYSFERLGERMNVFAPMQAEIMAAVTEEQTKRFSRYAEVLNKSAAYRILEDYKQELDEAKDVLEAELDDAMADFDAWDFKQLEKDDQRRH